MSDHVEEVRRRLEAEYQVEGEIGRGGMAVVYRAIERQHNRPVAIKVMLPELGQALGGERFLREIQLAAGLTHPRIVAVYASGDADGLLYYIMPFVDGPTLRARLDQQPSISVREAVGIARDVARALAYAHAHGVVHRDIKPENIMLPGGEAVVTDFGVARALDDIGPTRLTLTGTAIGTPTYMSPEQAFGEGDPKADVYSLGCVLYEMMTGRPPFLGPSAMAILAQHSTQLVPPLTRGGVPQGVVDALLQSLAKEPGDRPGAAELEEALRRGIEESGTPVGPSGGAAFPLAVQTIVVLPLRDLSQDQRFTYLCEGIAAELQDSLSRVPLLRVASRESAAAADPLLDLKEKARRLGVQKVLEGSVRVHGERIRVGVQLLNATDGFQLWSQRFDGSLEDVFAIEDRIAEAVVGVLQATPVAGMATISGPPTHNLEAHRHYLLGRRAWQRRTADSLAESAALFHEAGRLDPDFALAHVGLAEAHILQAVYGLVAPATAMPAARAAADRALALRPRMGEALSARASVAALHDWSWEEAERDFVAAVERHPGYATARQWYAMHLLAPLGRFADARAELERARLADPLSPSVLISLGQVALFGGSPDEAARLDRAALELEPQFGAAHFFLAQAQLESGQIQDAIASLDRAVELTGGGVEILAFQALAHGLAGNHGSAQGHLARLAELGASRPVSPVLSAIGMLGGGDLDAALDALDRAYQSRATDLVWLKVRPTFGVLRDHPRFKRLLAQLRLT